MVDVTTRSTRSRRVRGAGGAAQEARTPRPTAASEAGPPFSIPEDLDESAAPPLHGKVDPPGEMDDAKPSLDDEVQVYHHHPASSAATVFGFDPDAADAAADLAGELGATFLSGATLGEDPSDATDDEARVESDVPFLIEEEPGEEIAGPVPRRLHRRHR